MARFCFILAQQYFTTYCVNYRFDCYKVNNSINSVRQRGYYRTCLKRSKTAVPVPLIHKCERNMGLNWYNPRNETFVFVYSQGFTFIVTSLESRLPKKLNLAPFLHLSLSATILIEPLTFSSIIWCTFHMPNKTFKEKQAG